MIAAPVRPSAGFEQLYRANVADLHAYVRTLLRGDSAAAEDVCALAFERAYRRRRLYNPLRGTERAWLFGIARNAALDELRKRRRSGALPEGLADSQAVDATERLTVQAALAALEPRDRELVALKFHIGLSNAEIARVLGVSESNAGTRLHRVLEKLRRACDVEA